jgi:uncharacterized protein
VTRLPDISRHRLLAGRHPEPALPLAPQHRPAIGLRRAHRHPTADARIGGSPHDRRGASPDARPQATELENKTRLDYVKAMRRDDIIARLKQAEPALRNLGVGALYLFGSVARDEARSESDVDVFVDPASDDRFGFLQYMGAYDTILKAIGGDTELGYSTRTGLSRYIRLNVEREAIRIF